MTPLEDAGTAATFEVVQYWLTTGRLQLELPGSGCTAQRWEHLVALACEDLPAARIAEAHVDAVAILHELGAKPPEPQQLWAVWAAESSGPQPSVVADTLSDTEFILTGTKPWCSGAAFCSDALVTATLAGQDGALFAVALDDRSIRALPQRWTHPGMATTATRSVQFVHTSATLIGEPGRYLHRPGFWHGAIGVAACWLGGARAAAGPLYRYAAAHRRDDAHLLAHLGAVDAVLAGAEAMLTAVAHHIDADPSDRAGVAELLARRTRAVVEHAVEEVITRSARALGPDPLCHDLAHAQCIADLTVYVRQSHAERDLAALGTLCRPRQ